MRLVLGSLTARRRVLVGLALSVVAGMVATVVSGEWRISWAFLLIDIPLVAGSAVIGDLLSRRSSSGGPAHEQGHLREERFTHPTAQL